MAAGLGFKTFNTGDVLSASDTNGYLMQGVWVFANSTARDAAVTSPQEGNCCYLKDTDVIQVYSGSAWVTKSGGVSPLTTKGDLYTYSTGDTRLGVGTNGQVLTADSAEATGLKWAAVTGYNPNYTLLNSGGTSLSGSSTQISGISAKNDLYVWILGASVAANGYTIGFTLNGDTGNNYNVAGAKHNSVDAPLIRPISNYSDQANIRINEGPAASQTINAVIRISGCNSSGIKVIAGNSSSSSNDDSFNYQYQGHYTGSSTISSIEIKMTNGSSFDAGTVYVYGS